MASNSPRRRELLCAMMPNVEVAPSREVDETYAGTMPAVDAPVYLSQIKSEAYADLATDNAVVVTADTVVIVDNRILGKPADADEARAMLRLLSGRSHQVVTGVTLRSGSKTLSFAEVTDVTFAPLTQSEIEHYVSQYRPFDKAGSYGIQEWIGYIGISGINGCYYNVMGLPLHALYRNLQEFI